MSYDAYDRDHALLRRLGLPLQAPRGDDGWCELGTVELHPEKEESFDTAENLAGKKYHRPATTVKVEVASLPAQFWRFTVTRPRDEVEHYGDGALEWRPVYEPAEVFEITTGSGAFAEYWPSVEHVADHCFSVERKQ